MLPARQSVSFSSRFRYELVTTVKKKRRKKKEKEGKENTVVLVEQDGQIMLRSMADDFQP